MISLVSSALLTAVLTSLFVTGDPAPPSPESGFWLRAAVDRGGSDVEGLERHGFRALEEFAPGVDLGIRLGSGWRFGVGFRIMRPEADVSDTKASQLHAIVSRDLLRRGGWTLRGEGRLGIAWLGRYGLMFDPPPETADRTPYGALCLSLARELVPRHVEVELALGYRHAEFEYDLLEAKGSLSGFTAGFGLSLLLPRPGGNAPNAS